MTLEELAVVQNKPQAVPKAATPAGDVEETLLQLAYDQVDGKEAFVCMYVVAGEIINALHRMASYNPLFIERLNQTLLQSAERAKAETARKQ
ncbi:hypothetical protein [Dechloromonas sp. A34]|uniref:hypothetical protein n=1 Tax=Dechloromonas sp. A34 TaxID=447588 RepID=UPI00224894F8|nr:hypothetical protein [Dechloromonas sp. A34]